MKQFIKQFCLRGLIGMGFGPIVMAIVYGILGACGVVETMSVTEMVRGVISISVLAFTAAGMGAIYSTERLSLGFAVLLHALVLYADYAVVYLINGWLAKGFVPFLIFTACFFAGFAIIWLIVYLITKKKTDQLNQKLGQSEA